MQDRRVSVGGNSIRYLDAGSGSAVLLLHGLGGYADKWRGVIGMLSDSYRVIAPDMIGSGLSDKPVANYTPSLFVDFLKRFIEATGLERPHIVGASLGGQVAAMFAATHQECLSRLVLVSPAGVLKVSTPALDAYIMAALYPRPGSVGHALRLMEGSGRDPSLRLVSSFMENMRRPNAKMAFMSSLLCFKNAGDLTPYLKSIKAPTMLLWGYDDPIIPISYAAQFAAAIPDCRFVGLEDCGHTPYVQDPERFAGLVGGFLSGEDI
ncbi:MAG: alpha/beta hydrolase [Nitrosopumilaceae archaeon]|nr:alpha/beta hydrolase [Nitrosopumilaceae archaeon]